MAEMQGGAGVISDERVRATSRRFAGVWERILPLRYPLMGLAVMTFVTVGQLIEDARDTPGLEMVPPNISIPRWTLLVLTLYMLVMLAVMQRTMLRTLNEIRAAVLCDDAAFQKLVAQMSRLRLRSDVILAGVSVFIVVLLFPILNSPLPITRNPLTNERTYLPGDPAGAIAVLLGYSLVGWAGLSLVATTIRSGRALGRLTRLPLRVNIFDTENLLPLGRLALVLSLIPAGVVLILLVGLGSPTRPLAWFAFVLASMASIVALVFPLRGVHAQMGAAKRQALSRINRKLTAINEEMTETKSLGSARLGEVTNQTATLMHLRKIVLDAPTWPFQDTLAITRALLVASAPLIYAALTELIKVFLIEPLTR